jgi:tetratricopeptide (TPR) repeat protein
MKEQVIAGAKRKVIHDCWYSRVFGQFAQARHRQVFSAAAFWGLVQVSWLKRITVIAVLTASIATHPADAAPTASSSLPPVSDATSYVAGTNSIKAHDLVSAAINMTDSERAVKLLWQATEVDPTLDEPYMYLALYYNSRSQFDKVVEVYQKLLKYQPRETTAYINIGEAYMSFSPPKFDSALPYYLKALQLEPGNAFAALRIGEVYAQKGDPYRSEALRYLNLARSDRSKNPTAAAEADKVLHEMGAS